MAVTKDINSYATVAEADAYFAERLDAAAWVDASETLRGQALVTATNVLEGLSWVGTVVSDSQPLAFPREGSYFDPRLGKNVDLDPTVVPKRVLTAVFEHAYHLLNNDGLLDNTGSVESLTIGPITLTNIKNTDDFPSIVYQNIRPLFSRGGSSSSWWRAN
jgi:hypothetical protein